MTSSTPLLVPWLFLIISIYPTLFYVDMYFVSSQCVSHQQSLLVQLKDSLIFNATESTILVKWNQSSDCCTWEGVTCEDGRVTGLKLSNESISGGIDDNSTLFNLQNLKSLDLSYNYIHSTIPSKKGNLTNLTYISLFAAFRGGLTKLLILHLTNSDSYLESLNLRMLVQNLTELEELYLDGVNISAPGNEWGQALSSSLPNLRVLSLTGCSLSGPIHQSLAKLQYLSVIQLDNNILSSPVPRFFVNFSNLTSLQLSGCDLHGTFPEEIFQVPTLRILDISYNKLLEGSFPEFPPKSDIRILDIGYTNFKGRLPTSIGNLRQLSYLYISSCHFNGSLPNSIAMLTQLVHLCLSHNQFVGLIPSFNMSKNLIVIDLSNNQLSGPIPSFNKSKNLTEIDLSHNQLSGPIPSAHLEGLLNLIHIDLTNNSFNGNIPSSLFVLPSLERIELSYNQFSGQVLEFSNAPSSMLKYIDLSSNKLHGPIPMSVFKLKELEYLSLSSNNFSGIRPVNESSHGSNIFFIPRYLDLSHNHLYGEIPNWIWYGSVINLSHNHFVSFQEPYSLHYLSSLDLCFNDLHGKMPNLPPNADYLDLSSNCFTSSIPSDIGNNLTRTSYLSLANNGFTGVIPESICNASVLKGLDLFNNSLNGIIPTCMLSLSQIYGIKLRRNNLSGPIPDVFPVDCNLVTLDLNGNLLTNRIPKSLANCRLLEHLDLGNNQMLDTFPMFLENISDLRVLILQSNKLYGHITCAESIGFWPMIQIVDVASNNFSGELPGKCFTKWHAMMSVTALGPTVDIPKIYHEDAVSVTNKGLKIDMLKITYNGFTSIDFSSNKFHGEIPKELGQLIFLKALNLSNNVLSGQIPSSFGNLSQLESLDLSRNHLSGKIPASLSNLNFLGFLNLSYNQLHGRIPTGTQIQTFSADRFQGNQGLCGPPLTPNCPGDVATTKPTIILSEKPEANHSISGIIKIEWNLISAEIGFIVGFGIVIGPLVFWNRWRNLYFNRVEDIAFTILPRKLVRKWLSWKMGI